MNVTCPQCKTVFRVDPQKVPAGGVRARCSVCGGVFEVVGETQPAAAPVGAPPAVASPLEAVMPSASPHKPAPPPLEEPAAPTPPEVMREPPAAEPRPAPLAPEPSAETPPPAPVKEEPAAAEPLRTGPAATPGPAPARPAFGQPDPEARARRLARALISDVAAYHPERQEIGLREGRLKELFREELKKSWQEYVEQVGLEVAKSTPYFRDALNEILAKGKRVF